MKKTITVWNRWLDIKFHYRDASWLRICSFAHSKTKNYGLEVDLRCQRVRGFPGGVETVAGIIHEIHWFPFIFFDFAWLGDGSWYFLKMPCDVDSDALAPQINL